MGSDSSMRLGAIAAAVVVAVAVALVVANPFGSDEPEPTEATPTGADAEAEAPGSTAPPATTVPPTAAPTAAPPDDQADDLADEPEPPRDPTAQELSSATLLFPWSVSATKTRTITAPPDPIQPLAVGTIYMIPLNIEGACNNTTGVCSEIFSEPHFPMFGWTATEALEGQAWSTTQSGWAASIVGYYLSAQYGDAATCVYQWTEQWDVRVTDAVLDGMVWFATAFEGTMVRTEQFDTAHSAGDIASYCPPYVASDEWDVSTSRPFVAAPSGG